MTALVQGRGLTKSYGRHRGILQVSFDLAGGVRVPGPNGAGRTTALRTLMSRSATSRTCAGRTWRSGSSPPSRRTGAALCPTCRTPPPRTVSCRSTCGSWAVWTA
jgi:ABC-2 type transport system ATP-binding protein